MGALICEGKWERDCTSIHTTIVHYLNRFEVFSLRATPLLRNAFYVPPEKYFCDFQAQNKHLHGLKKKKIEDCLIFFFNLQTMPLTVPFFHPTQGSDLFLKIQSLK